MNKRYFYTDPLAAAWMAKHFGMLFQFENGRECYFDEDPHVFRLTSSRFFIHPDSMRLLEPQVGDAVEFDRWHWDRQRQEDMKDAPYKPHYGSVIQCGKGEWLEVVSAGVGWDTTFGGHQFAMQHKIIQRNGIPFMWPASEAA